MKQKKDHKIDKLPNAQRLMVMRGSIFIPSLARGHGSLRAGNCNAKCNLGPQHKHNRAEESYRILEPLFRDRSYQRG